MGPFRTDFRFIDCFRGFLRRREELSFRGRLLFWYRDMRAAPRGSARKS